MNNIFGENVRKSRLQCNKTLFEMAVFCGISEAMASMIETGKRKPSYETILALCDYFRCTPNDLMT
jgi:transcriptional regulator with XRE-family HTH domain